MKKCNHCKTQLLGDARFCHSCGAKVIQASVNCPKCNAMNLVNNKSCTACGLYFVKDELGKVKYQPQFILDFKETSTLAPAIKNYFLKAFQQRISEEHDIKKYDAYFERFGVSDFGKKIDLRLSQLAEEVYSIHAKQDGQVHRKVDALLEKNFNQLLDHFIILHCKDLNVHHLPEAMLSYGSVQQGEFDLQTMILHFLDLENEQETFYTDFILMPVKKLKNASQAFLFPDKDEKIMLIADQTIFGSCKEGFALTEKGLYWKPHFEKAKSVFYKDLFTIQREKDWLTINGNFFNVNPSVNLKMMKLLKRLKEIY